MTIQINGTSGISGVDGSAATPALQGSDTNTGISFGTDEVNINTGGSTRATVDSSGRLLVGTSSAISTFNYGGNDRTPRFQLSGDNTDNGSLAVVRTQTAPNIIFGAGASGTNVASGNSFGSVAFTGYHTDKYYTGGFIRCEVDGTPGSNDMPGRLVFSTTADGAAAPTERMRITNNGSTFINTTSVAASGSILSLGGSVTWGCGPQPGGSTFYVYNPANAGVYITNGANTWSSSSDERLKTIQSEILDGLSKVSALRAVNFTWKSDETNVPQVGLIAQDVQTVLPEAVTEDQGYLGVKYTDLIPLLVSALKESKERIETLEGMIAVNNITIDEMQGQLSGINARLTALEGGIN